MHVHVHVQEVIKIVTYKTIQDKLFFHDPTTHKPLYNYLITNDDM